jgi:hypothetical protein
MGEIIEMKKKTNLPNLSSTESPVSGTGNLKDATAAFTFSRLPRAQRVAITLWEIMKDKGLDYDGTSIEEQITAISEELAKYSVKDFAVRYGHLGDGKA